MKICLAADGDHLQSFLSSRFEEAKYFLFYETKKEILEVVPRKKWLFFLLKPVQIVTSKKPKVVITGNITPDSFDFLVASGIKVACGVFGLTIEETINKFKEREIKIRPFSAASGQGRIL